jgi:transposase
MCLHPAPIGEIPIETVRVARAAFAKGTVVMRLRDEFSAVYRDEAFQALYPSRGQPGLAPLAVGPDHDLPVPGEPE